MYKVMLCFKYHEMLMLWIFLLFEITIPKCFAILNGGKFGRNRNKALICTRAIYSKFALF